MKHLSLWLTVLLVGAAPLAAAAADYGPNCQLPAANNGEQQTSATQTAAAPTDAIAKSDPLAAGADDPSGILPLSPRVAPASSAPSSSALRSQGPMSSSKPRGNAPTKPAVEPNPATWQSMLPGSIQ
ncbi:MAG TPA: hypothetical protein VFW60_01165 [Rhodanobacteraceae bacterium]|nr:hypothetical protein [Rhodanobacteraceae bacterium]